MPTVLDGIIIGGTGGFLAGATVYLLQYFHEKVADRSDGTRIHKWLKENSSDKGGEQFRSTRAISSWNNLTEDRVRYLCSRHKEIFLSTGEKDDLWSIHGRTPKSFYEDNDLKVL